MSVTGFRHGPDGTRGRIVVWGLLAHAPFGGMTWQVLNHLVGLRQLGYDVWYVEDSDQRLLNIRVDDWATEYSDNLAYLDRYMQAIGMSGRWVFRVPGEQRSMGALDWNGLLSLYAKADGVLNICGAHKIEPHHDEIKRLVYLETDPVSNQVEVARGSDKTIHELARHQVIATYATNIGQEDCGIPVERFEWIPTVPPVALDLWSTEAPSRTNAFTTVLNWSSPEGHVEWNGRRWAWSKRPSFERFMTTPTHSPLPLEVAIRGASDEVLASLSRNDWRLTDAQTLDQPGLYRRYIRNSAGEFSTAKEQYVAPLSGWISDRTVCYLAAGRPAVVEQTGVFDVPMGDGFLDFSTIEEALEALGAVADNYDHHAAAAADLAREYFAADRVLESLMRRADLG